MKRQAKETMAKTTAGKKKQLAETQAPEQEIFREIRRAVDTGKVSFGKNESEKSVLNGESELVILCNNTPRGVRERLYQLGKACSVPVMEFSGTGIELGSVCGKPFTVSVMAIQKTGKSRILSVIK